MCRLLSFNVVEQRKGLVEINTGLDTTKGDGLESVPCSFGKTSMRS